MNPRVPLISDSDRRVPADWGQESQASSWVEAWNSPASRDVPGERGRLSSCIWNLGFFLNDAWKNCPFVLTAFTGWSSERCPGIGFLSRGDREIGVLRNVEPPTRPRLECLRETGLILRCDRKVGNPFQTKQGSRPSCPDQEGRKGSEEGVPENLSVPLEGDRDFGELCGSHQGCQVPFRPPIPNVGLLVRRCSGKGIHLAMMGEPRGFFELRRDSRVTTGSSGCLLCWRREVQSSIRVAKESLGLLSNECRANRPHLGLCPEANVPPQGRPGSRGCIPDAPVETGIDLEWKQRTPLCSRVATGISRSEEHTSELQSPKDLVCRLLLEKKKHRRGQPGEDKRQDENRDRTKTNAQR